MTNQTGVGGITKALAGTAVALALLAIVLGSAVSSGQGAVSPVHSHVFLSADAAVQHSHADPEASESLVINLVNHDSDSGSTVFYSPSAESLVFVALATAENAELRSTEYRAAVIPVPEPPPQFS